MKNVFILAAASVLSVSACASNLTKEEKKMNNVEIIKGKLEVFDFENFKLHVYATNDALADASFIVEGKTGLVTLEHPLFNDNIAEFNAYINALGKPVEKIIANYHTGGYSDFHNHDIVMAKGMPEFEQGPAYAGMMKHFAATFGNAIDMRPHAHAEEVDFGTTNTWAGVNFTFVNGASSDFPAASINIGNEVYYMHFAVAKMHVSALQISSANAIDAEIASAQKALESGCKLFIGCHGAPVAKVDDVRFKLSYLQTIKDLVAKNSTSEAFIAAMKQAYPNLPGEDNLAALAANLYK